jgi:hypothetical protein
MVNLGLTLCEKFVCGDNSKALEDNVENKISEIESKLNSYRNDVYDKNITDEKIFRLDENISKTSLELEKMQKEVKDDIKYIRSDFKEEVNKLNTNINMNSSKLNELHLTMCKIYNKMDIESPNLKKKKFLNII